MVAALLVPLLSLWTALAALEPAPDPADLARLLSQAATYELGTSLAPLRGIEDLVRQSASQPALRANIETGLDRLIAGDATYEARRFACLQLAVIGSDRSLATLAGLLQSGETAGIACYALSALPSAKAVEILRDALPAARGPAQAQIIEALGARRDDRSVRQLAPLARDPDAAVARAAIAALGNIADKPACQALALLRTEGIPAQARAVAEASFTAAEKLAASGDRTGAAAIYERYLPPDQPNDLRRGAFGGLLRLDQDGGERRIRQTLTSRDAVLTPVALAAISHLRSPGASARFAADLPMLPPQEQVWLLLALADRGDAAAHAAIQSQLAATDPAVRGAALAAEARLGDARSVPALCRALARAETAEERQAVETALTQLRGGPQTDRALLEELKTPSLAARSYVISALARRGCRDAVSALLAEADSPDGATAKAAFQALGRLASADQLPSLLDRLARLRADDVRGDAESAVARLITALPDANRRSEMVCSALARASDLEARCSLLRLLPACAGSQALEAVKAGCAEANPRLRDAAVRALAEWPDAEAWDALVAEHDRSEDPAHRALCLRALARLAEEQNANVSAELIARYRQLFARAQTGEDRKLVLGALAGAADPDALKLALEQLPNASAHAEAELAVRKIAGAVQRQHPQAAAEALRQLGGKPR